MINNYSVTIISFKHSTPKFAAYRTSFLKNQREPQFGKGLIFT